MKPHPLMKPGMAIVLLGVCRLAFGHCDSLDGPVVQAARTALDAGDVTPVLVWVEPGDAAEVSEAFRRTREVRALGSPARELADQYFFETLVRLHRHGEGASYTGLKPAGTDRGPAVRAADAAIPKGSSDDVVKLLTDAVRTGVREHFEAVSSQRTYDRKDVTAGRKYVASYVEYVHYVERVYEAASGTAESHDAEHP